MIIIPAVDIKNGKCVRLSQGRADAETIFSDDPASMAQRWAREGATIIHVVDLDGAFKKSPQNLQSIRQLLKRVDVPVQLGGGIRDMETISQLMDLGVAKVIIGTEAINNPAWVKDACRIFPGQIILGIDARDGKVAVEGWTKTTEVKAVDLAKAYEDCGVCAINFTDIHRDGMQTGPNLEATRHLAQAISIPVVASGGVSSIEDIKNLIALEADGVVGVITGKALYSGTLNLREALEVARQI
jgi:phosphoribosylformimino-5-aminoimidazole carboxamide ribotide isomerase